MSSNNSWFGIPDFKEAIDRYPLTVPPETLLTDVIALMSQTRGYTCAIDAALEPVPPLQHARSSCVLVTQGTELLGIFTERDIVKLTATCWSFEGVLISEVMIHPVITLSDMAFQNIFAALFLFRRYRIRHLVIVDQSDQWIGIVSPESIRHVLKPTNLLKIRRVSEVMSTQVVHAAPTTKIFHIAQLMAQHQVSCIVIVEEDHWQNKLSVVLPIGIITERDIVQFQALGLPLATLEAQVVMSTPLFLLNPEDSLWTAHQEMQQRRVQRLVVSWDWGAKLGIVTQTSLLQVFDPVEMYGVIETLQRTLDQMQVFSPEAKPSVFSFPSISEHARLMPSETTLPPETEPNSTINPLLSEIQHRLQYLATCSELPPDLLQQHLQFVLAHIQSLYTQFSLKYPSD
jgi:CBS domain-containing protein